MSKSISRDDGLHTRSLFPLYILIAKPFYNVIAEGKLSAVYHFRSVYSLTAFDGAERVRSARAKIFLPEISELSARVKSGSLDILFVSRAAITNPRGTDLTNDHMFSASSHFEGNCLWGKIPMDVILPTLEGSPALRAGGRVETTSTVNMRSCFMKWMHVDEGKEVSFQYTKDSEAANVLVRVPVIISAEERGAKDISAYNMYLSNRASSTFLSNSRRLRYGNVKFHYRYYNNSLQETEDTNNVGCPICLAKGASFKGLKYHLSSCHYLFDYEFLVNEDYQVVNVFLKTGACGSEIVADNVDPRQDTFYICLKYLIRRKAKSPTQDANNMHPLLLDLDVPEHAEHGAGSPSVTGVSSAAGCSFAESEFAKLVLGNNPEPSSLSQRAKSNLSIGQMEPRRGSTSLWMLPRMRSE